MTAGKFFATVFVWFKQLVLILLATLLISVLIIQTYDINDVSMEPTFDPRGNRVLVFLTPYLFNGEPNHGDIVIIDSRVDQDRTMWDRFIESPLVSLALRERSEHLWIKRVVGLPGDRLEFHEGRVYRNGRELEEDYVMEKMREEPDPVEVPEGHVFVMGDNRNRSADSRQVGPIPTGNIQGRVVLRFFPFDKVSTF